jgi:hypothetical protein
MIWINCLRSTLVKPRVAQPHRAGMRFARFKIPANALAFRGFEVRALLS